MIAVHAWTQGEGWLVFEGRKACLCAAGSLVLGRRQGHPIQNSVHPVDAATGRHSCYHSQSNHALVRLKGHALMGPRVDALLYFLE